MPRIEDRMLGTGTGTQAVHNIPRRNLFASVLVFLRYIRLSDAWLCVGLYVPSRFSHARGVP